MIFLLAQAISSDCGSRAKRKNTSFRVFWDTAFVETNYKINIMCLIKKFVNLTIKKE